MAVTKKTVTPVTEKKSTAVKVEAPKAEPVKATVEKVETTEKAEPAKKPVASKAKAAAKKTTTKKAELKSELHIQFGGKSYSQDDLLKIAKDVWKYDLKQKANDLNSVEIYVKPEENMAYYVMNKEFTGSFYI